MKYFIVVFAALVLFSCGNQKVNGIVTSSTPMFESESSPGILAMIPSGTVLEYTGDASAAKAKIRFNDSEGYIDREFIVINGKPGVIKSAFDTPEAVYFQKDQFIVYDSLVDNHAYVYGHSVRSRAWLNISNVDTDTTNAAVAALIDAMQRGPYDDKTYTSLAKIAASHSTHPRLEILKINLSEAPDEDIRLMQRNYSLLMSKSKNEAIASKETVTSLVNTYVSDILAIPSDGREIDDFNRPRAKYFYNYMCTLPSFVKLTTKSISATFGVPPDADFLKSYMLFRMDRSPENIKRLYDIYKPVIVEQLSSGLLQNVRPDLKALVAVYNRIITTPNHVTLMSNISKKVAQWDKENVDENGINNNMYTLISQASIYEPIIDTRKYDPRMDARGIWYSSFWARRFAEGNEKVVYAILKELSEIQQEEQPEGSDEGEGFDETELITCVFKDYGAGDCAHVEFTCGDYGDADISALSEAEQKLWDDLGISDDDGGHGNPDYIGKSFSMRIGSTRGPACNEGQGGMGVIAKILEFKMVD